jgi:hypothetical protein
MAGAVMRSLKLILTKQPTTNTTKAANMKTELLATNHPTVLRRLVRELNNQEAGFFTNGHRYNRARLSGGQLQIRLTSFDDWEAAGFEQFFCDSYSRQIVASRQPK